MAQKTKERSEAYRMGYLSIVYLTLGIGLVLLPIAIPLYVISLIGYIIFSK